MSERISTQARLAAILSSLGEPTRRRIVETLGPRQLSVTEIVEALSISQPTASKHLKTLREAGVIVVRPDAQRRLYSLSRDAFTLLSAWSSEMAANTAPVRAPAAEGAETAGRGRRGVTRPQEVPDSPSRAEDRPGAGPRPGSGRQAPDPAPETEPDAAASFLQNLPGLPRLSRFTRRLNGR